MFVQAIKDAVVYTKQFRTIHRFFGSTEVKKAASSMMVLNEEGWLLTCKHVAQYIPLAQNINQTYLNYKQRLAQGEDAFDLAEKFKYKTNTPMQLKNQFFDIFEGQIDKVNVRLHPTLDMALVHVEGDYKLKADTFPTFSKEHPEAGMMLCKVGFPFVEYTCVKYDEISDDIFFTQEGILQTPYFPLDGMVTRRIAQNGKIVAFEMNSPGLRGQSGGPVFDSSGLVYGMQTLTRHLDLEFSSKKQTIEGEDTTEHAFMHVGVAISSVEIIAFLKEHNVTYYS